MDKKQLVVWLIPIIARGFAWFFAVKLGIDATESQDLSAQSANAIGALILVGVSIYSSVKGRKTLQAQEPPKK